MWSAPALSLTLTLGLALGGSVCVASAQAASGAPTLHAPAATRSAPPTAEATRLFKAGSTAFHAHDLKAAHADFARLVRLAPKVAAAHSALGAVLLAEGDLGAATAELKEARTLDPHDTEALINLGVAQSRLGNFGASATAYRQLSPDDRASLQPEEALAFATALAGTGDRTTAAAQLQQAIATRATAELCDALGLLQAQQTQYGAARQSFAQALALDPKLAVVHAHTGSLLLLQGDATGAVQNLQQAVALGDTSPTTQLELGRALSASGHDDEALGPLRKALATQPQSLETQYALGLALQASGDTREALPLLAKASAARPDDAAALTNYGLALVQTGDAKAALALYTRASALEPRDITLREDMGAAYLQMNDLDHAVEQFQAGLTLDANNPMLHYDLGLAYKLKDNLAAAAAELERAEALDPRLPDPPYTLGVIRMQQGNAAEAVRQLQQAVALRPENGDAWALLGSEQKDAGNLDGAADALHHAVALSPDQPSPHINLAAILAAKGDREGAAAERKTAADLSRKAMSRQRAGFALQSGKALLARGDISGAIVQLQDAIAAEPDLKEAHLLLAEALGKQGRPADALAERQKAEHLQGSPQYP